LQINSETIEQAAKLPRETQDSIKNLHDKQELIDSIQEQCKGLNEGYEVFCNFIDSELSPQELMVLSEALSSRRNFRRIKADIEKSGYPSDRIAFNIFADKFGIQTTAEIHNEFDRDTKENYLNALPVYRNIQ
jgi:hypothetical protein